MTNNSINNFNPNTRKRIKNRGIRWKEFYKKKSKSVKRHFEQIMPGSYFRWEGFDRTTGHPYYIVVGPAISERYGKMFFAGIRKMPLAPNKKAYSPTGKYFPSLQAALHHAVETWGITFPFNAGKYVKSDLESIKIPRHMKGMQKENFNSKEIIKT